MSKWHLPQNGWHVAYPTINKFVFLEIHTDGDIIHVKAVNREAVEVPLLDIPKNRLSAFQWDMLMHLLQIAIGGDGEHD